MAYTPPGGWIETVGTRGAGNSSERDIFHTSETCELIKDPDRLRRVDKPYSSVRCLRCANPYDTAGKP